MGLVWDYFGDGGLQDQAIDCESGEAVVVTESPAPSRVVVGGQGIGDRGGGGQGDPDPDGIGGGD